MLNYMPDDTATNREILQALGHLSDDIATNRQHLERINNEMAGNGGPGLRTRIHSIETGYEYAVNRLRIVEKSIAENTMLIHRAENQLVAFRNIGFGIAAALVILEALRWLVPAFQMP